jgi:translation elongation factor EF-1alpha
MITGASQADCGILVIEAQKGGFERSFETGQTKEHAILARSLGVT